MTQDQIQTVSHLLDLARETLMLRENEGNPEPEDTPEVLALHRETIEAGERLLASLKEH